MHHAAAVTGREASPPAALEPAVFEAVCTPPAGLSSRGLRLLAAAVIGFSAAVALLFAWLGAWPIIGFAGAEAALVIGLLALHRRWSRRMMEVLRLEGGRLVIQRTDWRGRRETLALDPYWTRLSLEERPGRVSALVLRHRRRAVEIGALLGEEQKRDLAGALGAALRSYREPVFDNPQLREG
jgi:uncharacterized membrane protein